MAMVLGDRKKEKKSFDPLAWTWTVNSARSNKESGVVGPRGIMSQYWGQVQDEMLRKFQQVGQTKETADCEKEEIVSDLVFDDLPKHF